MSQPRAQRAAAVLEGGCECGRNQYAIYVPAAGNEHVEAPKIQFDGSSWSLRANAPPASVFLRIPLAWLQSTTYAIYPDESPALIRRSYTPRHAPSSKRFFCGVCADLLSVWSEASPEDAAYAHINWHTLEQKSREALDELGFLPDEDELEDGPESREIRALAQSEISSSRQQPSSQEGGTKDGAEDRTPVAMQTRLPALGSPSVFHSFLRRDLPWFDSMLEGSPLGRMRRRTGGGVSADGRTRIEWEIVEYGGGANEADSGQNPQPGTKRRLGDDAEAGDVTMH